MKKIISFMSCILILISVFITSVSATTIDGVLTLPEDDGTGYPVTGITDSYSFDEDAVKVIVPENIVRLGNKAFYHCTNLNQIKLHSKLQYIGEKAFEGTAYYEDVDNWEDGVLYIGDCLIKADPEKIPDSYLIRNGTRLIAAGAFKNCERLKTITVPDTIEYVGDEAFTGTSYYNNEGNWVNSTLVLGHLLVSVKEDLTDSYSIPEGIRTIADSAFSHSKVTEISTPLSMKHIGQDAFWDCQKLIAIRLNGNVETLGRGPFRMCDNLQEITVTKDNDNFEVVDGVLYNKKLSSVIRCPEKKTGNVVLPHSVKIINAFAFEKCAEIASVEIPEGCVFIGNSAFSLCAKLEDVIIPATMEYIDANAFSYCNGIESISIPDNVYYLGKSVFTCCLNLKEVTIGNGIKELRYGLFESCEKLNYVNLGDHITEIDDTAFIFTKYVSNVTNYKDGMLIASDKYLIKVAKDVTECYIPSGIKLIADDAFEDAAEAGCICEVHVPSSVTKFNWGAFYDVREIPIYYDGSIYDFVGITNFDWDSINLYTNDFYNGVWMFVLLFSALLLFVLSVFVVNGLKKHHINYASEEEYGED